jgi:hypothetical protein
LRILHELTLERSTTLSGNSYAGHRLGSPWRLALINTKRLFPALWPPQFTALIMRLDSITAPAPLLALSPRVRNRSFPLELNQLFIDPLTCEH